MFKKHKKSSRSAFDFKQVWDNYIPYINKIKDILIDPQADILAEDMCKRLLRFVWFLPASEGHHHNEEFGLFVHSIEVALQALQQFDARIYFEHHEDNDEIDSFKTRRMKPRMQYAHFVAGLLHDIGKVETFEVKGDDTTIWRPSCKSLYEYIVENNLNFQAVSHRKFKYYLHQKVAPYYASMLIISNDYEYIGAENIGDILNAIAYKPYSSNKFVSVIGADMASTNKDIEEKETKQDILADLLSTIREMFRIGKVPVNSQGARAWIFELYTAITVSVIDESRRILIEKGKKVPELKTIWRMFRERRYIESEDWSCVYTMELETMGGSFDYKVLKFRNKILWGDEKRPDICTLKVRFKTIKK